MTIPHLARHLAILFAIGLLPTATRADAPTTNPKTQTVSFKLAREDGEIKSGRERTIELVQLPAGTITLPSPDGDGEGPHRQAGLDRPLRDAVGRVQRVLDGAGHDGKTMAGLVGPVPA